MAEEKPIVNMSDESDPIVNQFRQLVELGRWLIMFYVVYLSIIIPLFGIIIGYLLKKNAIIPGNQRLGNACMILGIIFTICICICVILYFVVIVASLSTMGGFFSKLQSY